MLPAIRNTVSAMSPWMAPANRVDRLFDQFFDDSFFNFGGDQTGLPSSDACCLARLA